MNKGQRISTLLVGGVIAAGLVWLIVYLTNPFWRRVLLVLLAAEAYTLVNRYTGDTLSESVWRLSKRPLVPYLFGVACGWAIGVGAMDPLSVGVGFLMGHFFFQAYREEEERPDSENVLVIPITVGGNKLDEVILRRTRRHWNIVPGFNQVHTKER